MTIVGLGLIGGSLGLALKRRRIAREVVGVSRRASTLRRAKARGAVDWGTTDLARGVRDADVVVLATPVDAILTQGRRAARLMRRGAILTDVGSTKAEIVRALERAVPSGVAFVGAHPLAGSEQRGIEAADPALFDRSLCVVTPTPHTPRAALAAVERLWHAAAGETIRMSPAAHDQALAGGSHLPHLIAYSLALAVDTTALPRGPRSFLDMTRVAKSDPELWDDIFLTNRAAVLAAARRFERALADLRGRLARQDRAGLRRLLARAQAKRRALRDASV